MFRLYNDKILPIGEVKPGQIVKVASLTVAPFKPQGSYGFGPGAFTSEIISIVTLVKGNNFWSVYYEELGQGRSKNITLPLNYTFLPVENEEALKNEHLEKKARAIESHLAHSMSLGSDPEIFVEDKNGIVIPAFLFLGSKQSPNLTLRDVSARAPQQMYWDGFQAEFTTHANTCLSAHIDSTQCGLKSVLEAARKFDAKAKLSIKTVMDIPNDLLDGAKDEHVNFGCMPSLNSYGMSGRSIPGRDVSFRPAGGHIHMGVTARPPEKFAEIVKAMDAIVGVACVSLFASFDDPRRRELYGLAGEHRLPKHGLEYRVLSNAWLSHPFIMNAVFDLARKSFVFGDRGFLKFWKAEEAETMETINKCDVINARKILERNEEIMLKIFEATYTGNYAGARGYGGVTVRKEDLKDVLNIYLNGMESVIKDPTNIEGNWKLNGEWKSHANHDKEDMQALLPEIKKGKKAA